MSLNPQALAKYDTIVTHRDLDNVMDGSYESEYGIGSYLDDSAVFELRSVPLAEVKRWSGFDGSVFRDAAERADYDWLCDTMRRSGNVPPIALVLESGTYRIIDGHHRTELARELGMTELPAYVHEPQPTVAAAA